MIEISSAENPRFKLIVRLLESGRERRKAGLTVLDGVHLVAAYRQHVGAPDELLASKSGLLNPEVQDLVAQQGGRVLVLSDALFQQLSTVATPTGVMGLVPLPPARGAHADIGPCVLLNDIQDPGNLGSVLRSAAAAGVNDVLMSAGCAQAWSPRVLRAGMGAHFALRVYEHCDIAAFAARYRGRLAATVKDAPKTIFDADLTGDIALLFGNEGAGLPPELAAAASERLSIPMRGGSESLNVAAAAAVCLFERVRQLRNRPGEVTA